jgi:hypothetical protein
VGCLVAEKAVENEKKKKTAFPVLGFSLFGIRQCNKFLIPYFCYFPLFSQQANRGIVHPHHFFFTLFEKRKQLVHKLLLSLCLSNIQYSGLASSITYLGSGRV